MTLYMRSIRLAIWLMASVLAALFVWLQFRQINFSPVVNNEATPDIIWKISLAIYYTSWVFGTKFDTDYQELVLVDLNRSKPWPVQSIATLAMLFIVAAVLLSTEGNIRWFAIALCTFIVVDHAGWRYLIWFLRPAKEASEEYYKANNDFVGLEKLKVVVGQVQGSWKWWRLVCAGIPITALITGFAFSDYTRTAIDSFVLSLLPGVSQAVLNPLVSGFLVAIFVISVEFWHWAIRINTYFSLTLLDDLELRYEFLPKPPQKISG